MARIPDDVIERLKREVSLEALVRSKGIALKKHGENLLGKCPFHPDKTPSFVVTPSKNLWHCMGACQSGGTVIDFVMKLEGVSFPLAVEMLKKGVPSLAASSEETPRRPVKVSTTVKLEPLASADEADDVVTERVLAHYSSTLKQSAEAQKYLESRGLLNPEMLSHFRIGYANRTLGYHVPRGNRVEGEALRSQLTRLGFYRGTGREHFYGCITVPIFDAAGALTQMYGRRVTSPRDGLSHHLYMGRPHTSVWNAAALAESREVILCEALDGERHRVCGRRGRWAWDAGI